MSRPRDTSSCSVDGCENPIEARKMCSKHYARVIRHGDPNIVLPRQKDPILRFWPKIDKNGPLILDTPCWIWLGTRVNDGYGQIRVKLKYARAHRYSWELHNGPIPPGVVVMHVCDNPPCVNPAHLKLGSHEDNIRDMFSKGRANSSSRKLTASERADIISSRRSGETEPEVAKKFGVCRRTVRRLCSQQVPMQTQLSTTKFYCPHCGAETHDPRKMG